VVCLTVVSISNIRHHKESENKLQIVLRFLVSPIFHVYGGGLCHCQRNSKYSEKTTSFLKVTEKLYYIYLYGVHLDTDRKRTHNC